MAGCEVGNHTHFYLFLFFGGVAMAVLWWLGCSDVVADACWDLSKVVCIIAVGAVLRVKDIILGRESEAAVHPAGEEAHTQAPAPHRFKDSPAQLLLSGLVAIVVVVVVVVVWIPWELGTKTVT